MTSTRTRTASFGLLVVITIAGAGVAPLAAQSGGRPPAATDSAAQSSDSTRPSWEVTTGFLARRQLGLGHFLTAAQLASSHNQSLAEILTSRLPGLRLITDPRAGLEYLASTRGQGPGALISTGGMVPCLVQVFMDGTHMFDSEVSWIDPRAIQGVEYYDGTQTPATFRRGGAGCGALLIWTGPADP